jgi:uncharacterized protein
MGNLKLNRLEEYLRGAGAIAVAFSGGLDSRFLSYTALRIGVPVQAFHVAGPHIPTRESAWAREWAGQNGLPLRVLSVDPLEQDIIAQNTPERCYHCKQAVFTVLKQYTGDMLLCDGTNTSDSEGYRPGMKALGELGITSPLALAGLSKAEIRDLAGQTGMDRPDQAAHPCLFTRFNYGIRPTHESLAALDKAEDAVEDVLRSQRILAGNAEPGQPHAQTAPFRLRFVQPDKAVLHLAYAGLPDKLREDLFAALAANGFDGTPIALVDKISGYFDSLRGK